MNKELVQLERGQERFSKFWMLGEWRYQYDYRAPDGELFTCVKGSPQACRAERDKWLANR